MSASPHLLQKTFPGNDLSDQSIGSGFEKHLILDSPTLYNNKVPTNNSPDEEREFILENSDLLSNETVALFKELETLCTYYGLNDCSTLVQKIRTAINKELSKFFKHIEENYAREFKRMLHQPSLGLISPLSVNASGLLDLEGLHATVSSKVTSLDKDEFKPEKSKLLEQCPKEWPTLIKLKVVHDITTHHDEIPNPLPRKLTLKEALSSITGLFSESLATLLSCEVVRIYLYDENHNLHCCATFPYHATQADPMRGTYEEIMLVKDLHETICGKCIAVNGREATNNPLNDGDRERIQQEMTSTGLGSIRNCLIFPIISNQRAQCSLGLIHAVNKVWVPSVDTKKGISFSSDDELLMSMSSRILGCILTRYPVSYFSLRIGEAIRKAVFPHENDRSVSRMHIYTSLLEEPIVEDASGVGSRAINSMEKIKILRAPVTNIYQTSIHRQRLRRMGSLANPDTTLSSVEFNLNVMNELWKTGISENVAMHQQYRELDNELKKVRALLANVLDGLSSLRALREPEKMARYIQMLELYARSESTGILSDFIHNIICEEATRASFKNADAHLHSDLQNSRTHWPDTMVISKENVPEMKSKISYHGLPPASLDRSPFLTGSELAELCRRHERLNTKVTSKIHFDGPEGIRSYSCDPEKKREQIQFIDAIIHERASEPVRGTKITNRAPRSLAKPLATNTRSCCRSGLKPPAKGPTLPLAETDLALKRPFRPP